MSQKSCLKPSRLGLSWQKQVYKACQIQIAVLLLLFVFKLPEPLLAQENQLRFKHITIQDGLSQSSANCFLQDKKGFIWIGTQDGLNLYYGHRFTHFKYMPGNPNCLSDNNVVFLCEDSTGILWIGTYGGGLNRLDPTTRQFTVYRHDPGDPNSLADDHINSICEDGAGNLWIGTQNGLDCFNPRTKRITHYRCEPGNPDGLSDGQINSLFKDRSGNLWVGTPKGIDRITLDTKKICHFRHNPGNPDSLSDNSVYAFSEDAEGNIWIGTESGGVNRFDPATQKFLRYAHDPSDPNSLSFNNIRSIYVDSKGMIWIGTWGDGLNLYDPNTNKFSHFRKNPRDLSSLGDNRVYCIFEDLAGIIWVGTLGGGISLFDPKSKNFALYRSDPLNPNSLSSNDVRAVLEDNSGILWLGTYSGLNRYDKNAGLFTHYKHNPHNPNSLSSNLVYSLCQDFSGNIWVGTQGGGLNKFNPETKKFFRYRHKPGDPGSLSDNRVNIVYTDRSGVLWVGTWQGLSCLDPVKNRFVHFKHKIEDEESLSDDDVREIYQDSTGRLWIGTRNGGLNLFDRASHKFKRYKHNPENPFSLSDNRIFCIHEDCSGLIWIGTRGGGLNRFDPASARFSSYTEKDGLPNNVVYGILEDKEGDLWISTNNGLAEFNPKTEEFRVFDVSDGLQSSEFNFGAYFQNRSGKMFFGGIGGLNAFMPENIQDNPFIPPVVLIDFQVFSESVPVGPKKSRDLVLQKSITYLDSVELSHRDDMISLEFSSLHYTNPEENEYAYILEGLEKDWNYIGNRQFATYAHLPPGDYVFRVKGTNNDRVWNEQGTSINIIVAPPFWMTWGFRLSVIGIVFSLVFVFLQVRTYTIRERTRELERRVKDKTSELRLEIEERKKLEQSAHHSAAQSALLYEVGRSLSEELKLEELLYAVVNTIYETFKYYGVTLLLPDNGSSNLKLHAIAGAYVGTFPEELKIPYGKGMIGRAASTGKTQKSDDVSKNPYYFRAAFEKTKSELSVPLKSGNKIVGVLDIQSDKCAAFHESDITAIETLSTQIATAMENAHLYARAQQEIEERKKTEKEIEKRQNYLKSVLESTPNAIVTTDSSGRIIEWNPGAEMIFGFRSDEALGKDIDDLITKEDVIDEAKDWTRRAAAGERVLPQETIRYRKNGSSVHVIVAGSPIRIGEKLHGNVAVYTDITNLKRVEAELLMAKEEAQGASRAKSEFLANMSHEIRTPMNGILGMTELALGTQLTPEQREYMQAVKISAESLMNIINDILDFSKVEAKKIEIESVPFNLRDAIHSIVSPLAIQADRKGLELVYRIVSDVSEVVVGDPGRLRQVLTNLVGNAIKFTKKGEVVVSVKEELKKDNESILHFSVKDTGIGIAKEKLEKIFDPFFQADSTSSRSFSGTGLGLAITSQLIELMGGNITVESQPGKGSAFHFSLPFGVQRASEKKLEPARLEDIQGLPVLVVDDNATNRRILTEMLKNWLLNPKAVESGKQALVELEKAFKRKKTFQLVILDANMPEMDGFTLAERIKQNPHYSDTMIMMLSSSGMRGDAARCRKLGVTAYLTKPVKQSFLLESIQIVLGLRSWDKGQMVPFVTRHTLKKTKKTARILLAEDNVINQKLVVKILEKTGYDISVASNGEQAVSLLEKEKLDLVLMDIQMPKMDGFDATIHIREKEKKTGGHIPIIALTAHAMKGDRERCMEAGMDGYVSKPIKSEELLNTIHRVLHKQ